VTPLAVVVCGVKCWHAHAAHCAARCNPQVNGCKKQRSRLSNEMRCHAMRVKLGLSDHAVCGLNVFMVQSGATDCLNCSFFIRRSLLLLSAACVNFKLATMGLRACPGQTLTIVSIADYHQSVDCTTRRLWLAAVLSDGRLVYIK